MTPESQLIELAKADGVEVFYDSQLDCFYVKQQSGTKTLIGGPEYLYSESAIYTLINKLVTTDEQILHFNIILNNVMQRNHYNRTWAKFPPFLQSYLP